MIYVIESSEFFLVQQKIEEIKKKFQVEEDIHQYDLEEHTLDQVLEDLDTYSFFGTKKCIVVLNPSFLTTDATKVVEKNLLHLEKYIQNPNSDYVLIFVVSKLDERKKLVKMLLKQAKVLKLTNDSATLAKQWLGGYQLEFGALALLLEYCKEDNNKLYQECEKLKQFCFQKKKIEKQDIVDLVDPIHGEDDQELFAFINSLVQKKKKKSLEIYQNLQIQGIDAIALLGMLANQYRFIYQVKVFSSWNMSKEEIRKELNCHPYRIDKAKESGYYYSQDDLLQTIEKLAFLDYQIKSGVLNADDALKNFILQI